MTQITWYTKFEFLNKNFGITRISVEEFPTNSSKYLNYTKYSEMYDYKSSHKHKYDKTVTKYLIYKIQIPTLFIQNILTILAQIT